MADEGATAADPSGAGNHDDADWLERTATIVSAALVLALLALLLWDAFHPDEGPQLEATVGHTRIVGTQHYLFVNVENTGDEAAREVEVSVDLATLDSTDHATFRIDWLPGKSVRHGVVILPRSPSVGTVRARVTGYAEP